jgi:exodeoxyribonuclease VII large subunit
LATHERRRRGLQEKLGWFDLRPRLRRDRERWTYSTALLATLVKAALNRRAQRFETLDAKLGQLNPRLVLSRGYAIVLNEQGAILKAAAEAPVGSDLQLLFAEDALTARVIAPPPSR